MSIEEKVEIAAEALNELELLHQKFSVAISSADQLPHIGHFSVNLDSVTCLGVTCMVLRRPVAAEGYFEKVEYSFGATYEGEAVLLLCVYLTYAGVFKDSQLKNRLCDYDNKYAAKFLLYLLADRLIESRLFAPRIT